jgi:hypothetical protein
MAEPDELDEIVKTPSDPISPELVLVSPELAERARADLRERPWEDFLPPSRADHVPLGQALLDRAPVPAPPARMARPPALVLPAPPRRQPPRAPEPVPSGTLIQQSPAPPEPRAPDPGRRQLAPSTYAPRRRPPRATRPTAPRAPTPTSTPPQHRTHSRPARSLQLTSPLRPPAPPTTTPAVAGTLRPPTPAVAPSVPGIVVPEYGRARPIRHRRRRFPIGQLALIAAMCALLAVGSLPPRDAPTFASTPAAPTTRAATRPAAPTSARPSRPTRPAPLTTQRVRPAPAQSALRTPRATTWRPIVPSTRPKPVPPSRPAPTPLRPRGTFALGARGTLRVADDGRVIARLSATLPCLGQLIVYDIPVRTDGSFGVRRASGGRGLVTVWLEGGFVSADAVRGTMRARSSTTGCDSGALPFRGFSTSGR